MLAQSFKSAADLGITEPQLSALQKTLVLLETGKLTHVSVEDRELLRRSSTFTGHFNMDAWAWEVDCGTVCCIGGTAESVGGVKFDAAHIRKMPHLNELFYPFSGDVPHPHNFFYDGVTPSQAATALRSYLTTGDARWDLAVQS